MRHSKSSNAESAHNDKSPSPIVQLDAFWSWLPAFRVVAETRHLPTASKQLGVSASALSRSVRLLEQNLGVDLFLRVDSRLELTECGAAFLHAVRDGMRGIHDGMLVVRSELLDGVVRISSAGAITTVAVVPTLLELRQRYPQLRGAIVTETVANATASLLNGQLDLAIQDVPIRADGLESVELGALSHGIYCGPSHPLRDDDRAEFDLAALAEFEFVTPGIDEHGHNIDGWPDTPERQIGLAVDQMRVGAEVCAHGNMLAVLPDLLVERLGLPLRRLRAELISPTRVYATMRRGLRGPSRARVVLDALRERMRTA